MTTTSRSREPARAPAHAALETVAFPDVGRRSAYGVVVGIVNGYPAIHQIAAGCPSLIARARSAGAPGRRDRGPVRPRAAESATGPSDSATFRSLAIPGSSWGSRSRCLSIAAASACPPAHRLQRGGVCACLDRGAEVSQGPRPRRARADTTAPNPEKETNRSLNAIRRPARSSRPLAPSPTAHRQARRNITWPPAVRLALEHGRHQRLQPPLPGLVSQLDVGKTTEEGGVQPSLDQVRERRVLPPE